MLPPVVFCRGERNILWLNSYEFMPGFSGVLTDAAHISSEVSRNL